MIDEILRKEHLSREEIAALLSIEGEEDTRRLFQRAYAVKRGHVGTAVYFRGLIELGNVCGKDCFYCGIRRGNSSLERYMMTREEILDAAELALNWGYGSVVLQAGEDRSACFSDFIEDVIAGIGGRFGGALGVTLSLGEQDDETYRRWFAAGAHRYLLRIETSDSGLYGRFHPEDHSFERRLRCLAALKETGYQVGTGVMIGLPGQTAEHLAGDVLFFNKIDADMIGMGPYIPHSDTPMGKDCVPFSPEERLNLALRMIAVTRIVLKDVNIASTTALQALSDTGRELGLLAGANVIMPNLTGMKYRGGYRLYDGKPGIDENAAAFRERLETRIRDIGEYVGYGLRGDSPHYGKRVRGDAGRGN